MMNQAIDREFGSPIIQRTLVSLAALGALAASSAARADTPAAAPSKTRHGPQPHHPISCRLRRRSRTLPGQAHSRSNYLRSRSQPLHRLLRRRCPQASGFSPSSMAGCGCPTIKGTHT
jgi:hypothetical protein